MEVLENMSLIKINEDNMVWMHDQLKDLGKEIVRQESEMKIEKQSRVWDHEEGMDLLRRHEGKKEVEVLSLNYDHEEQYSFTYEGFLGLSNLRFLDVHGTMENFHAEEKLLWHESPSNVLPTDVFQENSGLLPQLRWLMWRDIPPTFRISNFSMKDVAILSLYECKITHDWKWRSHMKVMKNLKVLELMLCHCLERNPNLSANSKLERLVLCRCSQLVEIDSSICQLRCLVALDVIKCENLGKLPDDMGRDLASLEHLSLLGCKSLDRLPNSIGNLESLIELNISSTAIKELPDSIGNLKNLEVVNMWGCGISKIPDAIWMIEKLQEIDGKCAPSDRVHVNIGNSIYRNQSLRILRLMRADIYALPMLPESLTILFLDTLFMDTFPDLSNLTNLKELALAFGPLDDDVKSNGRVEDWIPRWIGNLSKLEHLSLSSDYVTTLPADLSLLPKLETLQLRCANLHHLAMLPSSLSTLHLDSCDSLCSMEDLSNLKKLSSLEILSVEIAEIRGLGCLENLQDLQLYSLGQVKILPDLSNLNRLRSVRVESCGNLVEIQGELPRFLDSLHISSCGSLQKLPDLLSLKKLHIAGCTKLTGEAILGSARRSQENLGEKLLYLRIYGLGQVDMLPNLSNLNKLRTLQVEHCGNLVEIQGELPQSLENLKIRLCKSLQKLPDLSSLKGLQEVVIHKCGNLVEIQGELPQSLKTLMISFCKSLQKFPNLSNLKGLQVVLMCKCGNPVEILGKLPQSLGALYIVCCESLQTLPNLSNLMELRTICIGNCDNLIEIRGELPQSLEELTIVHCESLQKLPDLSSLKGLEKVGINHCRKLNVEAISSLCSDKSVEFVGEDDESEGEDDESESEQEDDSCIYESKGEVDESEGEDEESESEQEDDLFISESEGEDDG